MKKFSVFLVFLCLSLFCCSDILSGQMHWVEDGSTVTNTADFSFDTLLQQGNISGFWTDETGTWMFEEGWLADGTYDFTVSSAVATYSELTDFDTVVWSIYEERIMSIKVEEISASFSNNQFQAEHWDYLFGMSVTRTNGTFSVVPEPATALLFCAGGFGAFLLRKNRLDEPTVKNY